MEEDKASTWEWILFLSVLGTLIVLALVFWPVTIIILLLIIISNQK